MLPILILAGAVLLAVIRQARSASGPRRSAVPPTLPATGGDVGLVAAREVRARVTGRMFRVGTLVMLAAAAAAIVIPVLERGRHVSQLGVVGELSAPVRAAALSAGTSVGVTTRLVREGSTARMRADLRSGRIQVALVDDGQVWVDKAIWSTDTSSAAQLARALSRSIGADAAITAAGLSSGQAAALERARPLPVRSLQPGGISAAVRTSSVVVLVLLFLMLTQYNTWTLIGVMEEKATRVVEVLLAAVGPAKLVTGKVLGIGIVVFLQAMVVFGFAFGLAHAVGSDLVHSTASWVLGSALVWLILGYAFNSWVYAAAGSMTERQSQVQTLALPLVLPIGFGYLVASTALASGSPSTLLHVLAYVPPTAPFAVTVLTALGDIAWWQFAISAVLTAVSTVAVARLAITIYKRAILQTGARVRLRDLAPIRGSSGTLSAEATP